MILHRCQAPIVEGEDVHASEITQEPAVGAVGPRELEIVEESRGPAAIPGEPCDERREPVRYSGTSTARIFVM